MKVIVAQNCGFCPGVRNAISMAEKVLAAKKDVHSLGPIIHNKDEVRRLAEKGLRTVDSEEQIGSGTVLIRSHGAAPEQIEKLRKRGLEIVDATCVLVKRVQHIAGKLQEEGYTVAIVGDRNHPEVQAVVGSATDVVVITGVEDLHKLPKNGKLGIVCQTTESPERFVGMVCAAAERGFRELRAINTLCREAMKRQQSAVRLCKKVEVMFVLGGLESANTRRLAELCKKYNSSTFHLQNWEEFDKKTVFGKRTAGVTAGASTPAWIIDEFVRKLSGLNEGSDGATQS